MPSPAQPSPTEPWPDTLHRPERAQRGQPPGPAQQPAPEPPHTAAVHPVWTRRLHWGSALLVLLAAATALAWDVAQHKGLRVVLMQAHRQIGLLVLLALAWRLLLRWRQGLADHAGALPAWQRWAAHGAHIALYAMLAAMPLLGIAAAQAHAVQIDLFGLLPLPMLVADDPDLADQLAEAHVWGAWLMGALVLAHLGAALWHHWVQKDGVLRAMWPTRGGVTHPPQRAGAGRSGRRPKGLPTRGT